MNKKTIQEAVETIVSELIAAKESFSAHEVTLAIRDRVNRSEWDISDVSREDYGNGRVSNIEHFEVNGRVRTYLEYTSDYSRVWNGKYFVYTPKVASAPPLPSYSMVGTGAAQTPSSVAASGKKVNLDDDSITQRISNYLCGNTAGTIKGIQSMLKRYGNVSTDEIKDFCHKKGWRFDSNVPADRAIVIY